MKIFYFTLSIFICVFLCTCKKQDLGTFDPNYNGEWHSDSIYSGGKWLEVYFIIDGGQGTYGEWCELTYTGCNCGNVYSGKARINERKKKIYIGETLKKNGRVVFNIDESPHINDKGKWQCTLTSRVFIRK